MEAVILREFRKMPFCRQDKTVLRKINTKSNRKELSATRNTYFALTEIASNQENEKISTYLFDIAKLSGLGEKTISKCLDNLEELGIVFIQPQERGTDGRYKNKEIWLIGEKSTVGKLKESSKKVRKKMEESLVPQVTDNKEDSLEDNIESSVEGKEKTPPLAHKNIEFINGMRDVELRGNNWLKIWNEKTGREDIMTEAIKKAMYVLMKGDTTYETFEIRVDNLVKTISAINEKQMKKYIYWKIWEFDFLQFLDKINYFHGETSLIISKIAINGQGKEAVRILNKNITQSPPVEEKKYKKIYTPEETNEVKEKFRNQFGKLKQKTI